MKINEIAQVVLKKYWDKTLPVDPKALAIAMKAQVIEDPNLGETSGQFTLGIDGAVIRVNTNEPPVRQRFTIAHEIGHYVLGHGDDFRDTSKHFSAINYDPKEIGANRFAAALLMPEEAVAHLIKDKKISDLRELAKLFDVSEAAMKYRLKNLGWIS